MPHLISVAIRSADEKGTISYGAACSLTGHYDLEEAFKSDWGIAGDWENPEDGSPIGLDLGELIVWISERKPLS